MVEAEAPPSANTSSGFANPLQVGSYVPATARIDLSAEDEAGLDDYEKQQRGLRPGLALGMTIGVGVVMMLLGFFIETCAMRAE